MDFIYLLRVLLKRKWIIIGAALVAAFVAWYLTRNELHQYRSLAQVSTGFTISDEIKVNNESFSFFEADVKFNNAIVTFTSPTVISLLSYTLILHDLQNPVPFRRLTKQQLQSPLYARIDKAEAINVFRRKLESMSLLTSFKDTERDLLELLNFYGYDIKDITNSLNVARLQRTDYIQIEFTSENPELSAYIVNNVFLQFLRYYKSVRSSRSMESIDTLQSLLEKRKQELDEKNAQLRNEGITDVGQENSSKLEIIMNLEGNLTDEQSRQTTITYSLQKVNQKLANLGVVTSPGNNTTKLPANNDNEELLILRKQMNDAYIAYLNTGSSDPVLQKKYEALKADYQEKIANSTDNRRTESVPGTTGSSLDDKNVLLDKKNDLEVDLKASTANIQIIQNKIDNLKGTLVKDATKGAVIETMLKDAELANKEYSAAKQKYSEAIDITTSSVNNFRQILQGQPAIEPEPSKRKLIVGMAGASALVITVLILIILAYLDSSIKTPVIFSRVVNLKLISLVNFMNLKNKDLSELITTLDTIPDALDNKRHNVFREALRKLRYEVESSGKKTFLFASTKKGEGKTTLIQALAYSMSLSKKKILIIDTNFCNNDLTLQLHADPILEKIHPDRANSKALIEQVRNAAKNVGSGYISVIGSQGGDYTPSEILPRENLLHHLNTLTGEYDYIFLEGPPLNDFTDSKELAQYVDGVIAIFSAGHIIKQVDKQSLAFFQELNGKFVGAILNMVDPQNVDAT